MLIRCSTCQRVLDDQFRTTICPHQTFAANDGANNFAHHPDSYLGDGLDLPAVLRRTKTV